MLPALLACWFPPFCKFRFGQAAQLAGGLLRKIWDFAKKALAIWHCSSWSSVVTVHQQSVVLFGVCLYEESKALAPCGVRSSQGWACFSSPAPAMGKHLAFGHLLVTVWGCHPVAAACAGQRCRGLDGARRPPTLISHPWGDAGETWGGGMKVVLCKALHCTEGRKLNLIAKFKLTLKFNFRI